MHRSPPPSVALLATLGIACTHANNIVPTVAVVDAPALAVHAVALPGSPEPVRMDYLAWDPNTHQLWVPAGNTGRVDVLDGATGTVTAIEGFPTIERTGHGGRRVVGPSSATVGDGVVYVGNRADSSVCALDAVSHARRTCVTLPASPDGLAWVSTTRELWVTAPSLRALLILPTDAAGALQAPVTVTLAGEPEGYAVDPDRGVFYTNLEDGNRTLAIDVHTRQVVSTWEPGCGEAGPRGLAFDGAHRHLVVACTDHLVTLDASGTGAVLGQAPTGGSVDNICYAPALGIVYAASGTAGAVRAVRLGNDGALTVIASGATAHGTRVVVADAEGHGYVADSDGGRIFVVDPPH